MATSVSFTNHLLDLHDPFELDWLDHPQWGPLNIAVQKRVNVSLKTYAFNEGTITIDTAGPKNWLSTRTVNAFGYNFDDGDPVLLGENVAGQLPVHLIFDTPMRAIGTHISASANTDNVDYLAQFSVRLSDGSWRTQHATGLLSPNPGTAPFLAAQADAGTTIVEAWFDVVDPRNVVDFIRVAINRLLWIPA